ncbi:heme exporter protein CcmD [Marinomonas fungiae]|uniref:Heme exporter protein D n=1 Tax=Marinomonas fungiae TaxID=1137284 RepID=A0A0K6IIW7_9GAMM|nr:heme exporter protein CcmD [Marinomonas fungiae]CUB03043.1 heme exporter protein CcmD [Marinomonas fungiae]
MAFESIPEFLKMGTHGIYVWSTYGISLIALVGLFVSTRVSNCKLRKQLKKRYQREQSR